MAQGTIHALPPSFVRQCATPGVYSDGGSLKLRILPNGLRYWIMRITIHGKRRDISLGSLTMASLAEARDRAHDIRKVLDEGSAEGAETWQRRG